LCVACAAGWVLRFELLFQLVCSGAARAQL